MSEGVLNTSWRRPAPSSRGGGKRYNFNWIWRQHNHVTRPESPPVNRDPARRRYNVCLADSGLRVPERQSIPQVPLPDTPLLRTVYIAENVTRLQSENRVDACSNYIMAAGVLFYCGADFLLGREQIHPQWDDSGKWADFGGGVDVCDVSVIDTAAREAWEETMGCVLDRDELVKQLTTGKPTAVFDIQAPGSHGCYRLYLLPVNREDYGHALQRFRAYHRQHKITIADAEKTELEWVSAADLIERSKRMDPSLRPNFAHSIVEISKCIDLEHLD